MNVHNQVSAIHSKFMGFRSEMNNIWEEYIYLDSFMNSTPVIEYRVLGLYSNRLQHKSKGSAGGMKSKFLDGGNTKNHYIEAICRFEEYINYLTSFVYHDFPAKIGGNGMDAQKIFEVIIRSEDKESIVDCIIEEKIRSIFYGNPIDIFVKDKCKLELGTLFTDTYKEAMPLLSEIIGRRNLIIHNSGKVDRKFIKENPDTKLIEGRRFKISQNYLRGTIGLLIGIAAVTTKLVIEKNYKAEVDGKLRISAKTFSNHMGDSWYKNLLENN